MKRALIIIGSIVLAASAGFSIIAVIRKNRSKFATFLDNNMEGEIC